MAIDLTRSARLLAAVVVGVPDDALDRPTPCPDFSVRDLLEHLDGFCRVFTAAATKSPIEPAAGEGLAAGWRTTIPARLDVLAEAWADPSAWEGATVAAGVDLPAPMAGMFALDETVVHGWDLATATGQAFVPDADAIDALLGFLPEIAAGGAPREGLFGPPIAVAADASPLDRVLGLTGRDPARAAG